MHRRSNRGNRPCVSAGNGCRRHLSQGRHSAQLSAGHVLAPQQRGVKLDGKPAGRCSQRRNSGLMHSVSTGRMAADRTGSTAFGPLPKTPIIYIMSTKVSGMVPRLAARRVPSRRRCQFPHRTGRPAGFSGCRRQVAGAGMPGLCMSRIGPVGRPRVFVRRVAGQTEPGGLMVCCGCAPSRPPGFCRATVRIDP